MLKRIHIRGYKSFRSEEVRLEPLTALFGTSASGKSNFINALQLLARLGTGKTVQDAFDPPHRGVPLEAFPLAEEGIRGLLAKPRLSFSIEADLELSEVAVAEAERCLAQVWFHGACRASMPRVSERSLRYRVKVEMQPATGGWRVVDEFLAALNRHGEPKRNRHPFIVRKGGRILLRDERCGRFLGYRRGLDHTLLSAGCQSPYGPHLMAARAELEHWKFLRSEPDRMRVPGRFRKTRDIGGQGENLAAVLHTLRISKPKQFRAVEAALRMLIPEVDGIETSVNDWNEAAVHVLQDGALVSMRVLSEGMLRWLGLLAAAGSGGDASSLVAIEEPENGIHPGHIRLLAELLKTRAFFGTQCVVVTNSPLLPDRLPEKSLLAVRRRDRASRIDAAVDFGPLGHAPEVADWSDLPPVSHRILRGDFN